VSYLVLINAYVPGPFAPNFSSEIRENYVRPTVVAKLLVLERSGCSTDFKLTLDWYISRIGKVTKSFVML